MSRLVKYRSSISFFIILALCVGASVWLSHFIPDDYFDGVIMPILIVASTAIGFVGAWLVIRHSDGLRVRRAWACTLLCWAIADGAYVFFWLIDPKPLMNMGAYQLTSFELLIGNLLGWVLLLYPTEALRPSWLNVKHALWELLPMCILVAVDYILPANLQPIIALYPFVLISLLFRHIQAYRTWCEENFSTFDDIDVEWIIRYLSMLVLVGLVYFYMCISHQHARGFTQLWLIVFMLAYSTEQILFRHDPWELLRQEEKTEAGQAAPENAAVDEGADAAYREVLERWMAGAKPYRNPDFKITDLERVLPMNRTGLSRFIRDEYNCSFYQFVNRYRVEEAKRLKLENPALTPQDVSVRCGFSSPMVFSRTFTDITGLTPNEWVRQNISSLK